MAEPGFEPQLQNLAQVYDCVLLSSQIIFKRNPNFNPWHIFNSVLLISLPLILLKIKQNRTTASLFMNE